VADWVTISSLATAGGTLALAVATYSSVRSANRSARIAERSLQIGLRPVLTATRYDDPPLKVAFGDRRQLKVAGAMATIDDAGAVIYLAFSVRNVGSGLAVMRGWHLSELPDLRSDSGHERERLSLRDTPHPAIDSFRRTQRDIYVPPGDIGFWQGAIREPDDPFRSIVNEALRDRRSFWLDLLYGDHEEGQPTITRFGIVAREDGDGWSVNVARHWSLERERR
jgi:hypothetical protein